MSSFQKKIDHDSDDENESKPVVEVETTEAAPEEITTCENSDVTTKYQEAAKIANLVLKEMIAGCVAGARVLDLSIAGDKSIEDKCAGIFRGKVKGEVIQKGVAFPVCLSVNECVCNVSPLPSDDQSAPGMVLANDDMVKIDLGVHIDGYIAVVAHTVIVGTPAEVVSGARANAFNAAWDAARTTARMIVPGNTNTQVAEAVNKIVDAYDGINYVVGVTMHQMKRFVIDGNKVVNVRPGDNSGKVDACTFEKYETYAVDICVSSGEGKPKDGSGRTTVYKRNVDKSYQLKMKAARTVFNEVSAKFPTMPFSMRSLDDERGAKLGLRECTQHDLLQAFPVIYEKAGDQVVHFRYTLLLLQNGTSKITGVNMVPEGSPYTIAPGVDIASVDQTIADLLAQPEPEKKKRVRKPKAKASA